MSDFGIAPDTNQYLVKADQPSWGVNYQAYANYDYAIMSNDQNNQGCPVVFHTKDDGYLIESTSGDWADYRYWAAANGSGLFTGDGIWLSQEGDASVWKVRMPESGPDFVLWTGDPNSPLWVCYRVVDNWLCAQNSLYGNVKAWISFQAVNA